MPHSTRASHTFFWCLLCAACGGSCASDRNAATVSSDGAGGTATQLASASSTSSMVTSTTEGAGAFSSSSASSSAAGGMTNSGAAGNIASTANTASQTGTTSDASASFTGAGGMFLTSVTSAGGSSSSGAGGTGPLSATKVWLAGDSTMANGNTPCPTGWGKHLKQYLNALVTVDNSAAGGRSVRTWLYNVTTEMDDTGECVLQRDANGDPTVQARWQNMLDNMQSGDTLLIQFGINDGSATCDRHVGLEAFKESYGVMATAARERGAEPVFITPVSSIACNGTTPRGTRGGYVDATIEAGQEYDVPVIDLHQSSVELYTELGFCPVPGGDVSADTTGPVGDFFCDDHTHFSDSGAIGIAGLVASALREQPIHLARYVNE